MSWLRIPKKAGTSREHSDASEKRIAKRLGGQVTPGSGAKGPKGDIQSWGPDAFMVEHKTTAKTQFTLKLSDLHKLENEARLAGCKPLFIVELNNEGKLFFMNPEWVLMPLEDYEALKGAANGNTD